MLHDPTTTTATVATITTVDQFYTVTVAASRCRMSNDFPVHFFLLFLTPPSVWCLRRTCSSPEVMQADGRFSLVCINHEATHLPRRAAYRNTRSNVILSRGFPGCGLRISLGHTRLVEGVNEGILVQERVIRALLLLPFLL